MTETILSVVTGAGTGIGQALSRALAGAGHEVIAVGRREAPLQETAEGEPRIAVTPADVADPAGRERVL